MPTAIPHTSSSSWRDYNEHRASNEHSVVGTVKVYPNLWSTELLNQRDLLVYLPPSYGSSDRRYPVLYMHDGQNLFDQATSFSYEWQVDETMQSLSAEGLEAIVVGIPNTGTQRLREYSPFSQPRMGGGAGERYLAWVTQTVKPMIDQEFRTLPTAEYTGILGSSMGGLISMYAMFRYRHVFGMVGAMSPAFWFNRDTLYPFIDRLPFLGGKVYLDVGTSEGSERFRSDVRRMFDLLRHKGYQMGRDLLYVEELGGMHDEIAWGRRLPTALRFLLPRLSVHPR